MDLEGIKTGIKASIIAASCCSLPLALAFLSAATGVGSITAALQISRYEMVFFILGTVFLIASVYLTIRNRCHGTCSIKDAKTHWRIIVISVLTYIILTITLVFGILPLIAQLLFN